jgi:hypothetical protein
MVDFVSDLRVRFPAIQGLVGAMVKAVQEALKNPEVLYPLEDALPSLREAAALAKVRSLPFWIFNLPQCVLPELADIVFSPYEFDRTLELDTLVLTPSKAAELHCVKGRACLDCARFESCSGYLRTYEERFGSSVFRPPPELRRAEALPESLLQRAPRAEGAATRTPVPVDGLQRMSHLLTGFSHGGWRVHDVMWDATAPWARWVVSMGSSAADAPLVVHLEPGDVPSSFLKTEVFSLSYRGYELPAAHERVLRALFQFLTVTTWSLT